MSRRPSDRTTAVPIAIGENMIYAEAAIAPTALL